MLKAVDNHGNCLLCNADDTTTLGVPVIIHPAASKMEAIKRASRLNGFLIQEYADIVQNLHT
jgi:hypothetical protein